MLLRAAAHEAPPVNVLAQIEVALGLDGAEVLRYADPRRGQRRSVRLAARGSERRIEALLLAGDTAAESWLKPLLQDALPVTASARQLLSGAAQAPGDQPAASRQVCTCFDVREDAIQGALAGCTGSEDERLSQLQGTLRCGTNCGSCVPELRRMVRAVAPQSVAQ